MSLEIISFVASGVASFIFKMYANSQADKQRQFEMAMQLSKQKEEATKSAREFQPNSYVRRFIAISIVSTFIYIITSNGLITYIAEVDKESYFFGLFGGGTELAIKQVMGPILTKDFIQLMYIIVGFYFGSNLGNRK